MPMPNPQPLQLPTSRSLRPRRGTPPYVPNEDARHVVKVMRANGNTLPTIARALRVNVSTVERHFKQELKHGFDDVKARVEAAMVKSALAGNVGAQARWLAKHCAEWRFAMAPVEPATPDQADVPGGTVHFYLPPNGRDGPDPEDTPTIEGEAEAA